MSNLLGPAAVGGAEVGGDGRDRTHVDCEGVLEAAIDKLGDRLLAVAGAPASWSRGIVAI